MLLLRRPAKKGSEMAFQSRKAPRALGSVVCRKWIQQRVHGEGCKDCKAPGPSLSSAVCRKGVQNRVHGEGCKDYSVSRIQLLCIR